MKINKLRRNILATFAVAAALLLNIQPVHASGGSGGGGGGGGTQTPTISSFKATAGYRPGGGASGAVWTSYSVQGAAVPNVRLTIMDLDSGNLIFNVIFHITSQTVDDDFVPFSTNFLVQLDLLDSYGNVLESRSTIVTTPAPKTQP